MMRQYQAIKEQHKDYILFFRLGDFYEMFFDDAVIASKELELVLTGRDCGQEERAPMCGVPHHSCEAYIARLVKKGYKVAICEQTEDPSVAKGIVRREVVRVVTPGTVIESSMLNEAENNYISVLYLQGGRAGAAYSDITTGDINLIELSGEDIISAAINETGRFSPSEVLLNAEAGQAKPLTGFLKDRIACVASLLSDDYFEIADCTRTVLLHFKQQSLAQLQLEDKPYAVKALGALLRYLGETQKSGLERLISLNLYGITQYMNLDVTARRNLELTETMRSREKRATLLWVLDKTKTAMGKRLIKSYIEQPLLNPTSVLKRLTAVEELYNDTMLLGDIRAQLEGIYDLERIMTRIVYGSATPRELKSLSQTAGRIPALKARLAQVKSRLLEECYTQLDPLADVTDLIDRAISDDPPITLKDGGVIKAGYHQSVDEYREIIRNTKEYIAETERREKEKTGIKTLKIGYNKVFGYYLEVSKSYAGQVPEDYIRKQTLANGERYITEELKQLEARVLGASERILALESELFAEVKSAVAAELHRIQLTARAVARLDVLCSFAFVSRERGYTRPDVDVSGEIILEESRHPVIEGILSEQSGGSAPFVSNNVRLDMDKNRIAIITGPNMAGKSTYMRQVALIVLMAQIGCFVPAKSAKIGIVDSIFTRVGASDDLSTGQSTFMVEMNEVAHILKNATAKSLIILDEIGRGTSTYDGMSIARAVLEYIADKRRMGAKTLFATHYHELTELEDQVDGVLNYNIAVKKRGDDITFLRRIVRGGADDSYGIEVSKLAGIPESVIARAKEILKGLEEGCDITVKRSLRKDEPQDELQLTIEGGKNSEIIERLRRVDINTLTPIEALNLLYGIAAELK